MEDDSGFKIEVRKSRKRKSIAVAVYPDLRVIVSAPMRMPLESIKAFIEKHHLWISKRLRQMTLLKDQRKVVYLKEGALIPFYGETLKIRLIQGKSRPALYAENTLWISSPHPENEALIRKKVIFWIQQKCAELIQGRIAHFSSLLQVIPRSVKVRNYKGRWGSCRSTNDLSFNWRISLGPPPILDYVVVHELAHIREFNHSAKFWELVESVLPNYKQIQRELKHLHQIGALDL